MKNANQRREFAAEMKAACRLGTQSALGIRPGKANSGAPWAEAACPPQSVAHCNGTGDAHAYDAWNPKWAKVSSDRSEKIARLEEIPGTHGLGTALTWTNASCSSMDGAASSSRRDGGTNLLSCQALTVEQPAVPWKLDEKFAAFFEGFVSRVTKGSSFPPTLEQAAAGLAHRPFFFYLAPLQPHGPWLPAPRWQRPPADPTDASVPFSGYLDTMAQVDEMLGRVLATLDSAHVAEETLVILTSDNGQLLTLSDTFGTHSSGPWHGGKYYATEGGHRVPGLWRWPGRIAPGVSGRLTSHLDILPTLANLVGAPAAVNGTEMDGEDLGDWMFAARNESATAAARYHPPRDDRVLHIYNTHYAYFLATRIGKHKVWHKNDHKKDIGLVVDLDADPSEAVAMQAMSTVPQNLTSALLAQAKAAVAAKLASISVDRQRYKIANFPHAPGPCCNPNHYDCSCPFPSDGLALLASSAPVRVTPVVPPGVGADPRCADSR